MRLIDHLIPGRKERIESIRKKYEVGKEDIEWEIGLLMDPSARSVYSDPRYVELVVDEHIKYLKVPDRLMRHKLMRQVLGEEFIIGYQKAVKTFVKEMARYHAGVN
jgi:hypothetical protein